MSPPEPDDAFFKAGLDRAATDFFLRQEFQLDYQPILSLDRSHISGFEALLHLRRSPIQGYPADYIALIEATSLRAPLTQWILREASLQVQQWQRYEPLSAAAVSVNLSLHQLRQGSKLVHQLEQLLIDTGISPRSLELEIPGTVAAAPQPVTETLKAIRQLGLPLYLDSLSPSHRPAEVLQQMPVEAVKIVPPAALNTQTIFLKTALRAAADLGIEVIAKQIETPAQLEQLQAWGVRYGQGFLLAHPAPPEDMLRFAGEAHELAEFGLAAYLAAMNRLSLFLHRFLGCLVGRYWQQTKPSTPWLRSLTPLASGELILTGSAPPVIDLLQQQDLRRWTWAWVGRCRKILPQLLDMLARSALTPQEQRLLGLGRGVSPANPQLARS